MHSFPARRAAKALTGLVVAAGLALGADALGQAASTGEGETVKQIFSQKLPNVPGKTLTVVQVDYRPGGFSAPHRHPASGFVFAYVLSGTIRSRVEGEPPRRLQRRPDLDRAAQRSPHRQRQCEQDQAGAADRLHHRR